MSLISLEKTRRQAKTTTKPQKIPSSKETVTAGTLANNRKHLQNVRVVQRNLVYAVGLPLHTCREEVLKRNEWFGKFGKIVKISANRNGAYSNVQHGPTGSAYVTFSKDSDALKCIQAMDGSLVDGRSIRACFGTTKYCNAFLRGQPCTNPDCLYLHDFGSDLDSFTKEEMLAKYGSKQQVFHHATRPADNVPNPAGTGVSHGVSPLMGRIRGFHVVHPARQSEGPNTFLQRPGSASLSPNSIQYPNHKGNRASLGTGPPPGVSGRQTSRPHIGNVPTGRGHHARNSHLHMNRGSSQPHSPSYDPIVSRPYRNGNNNNMTSPSENSLPQARGDAFVSSNGAFEKVTENKSSTDYMPRMDSAVVSSVSSSSHEDLRVQNGDMRHNSTFGMLPNWSPFQLPGHPSVNPGHLGNSDQNQMYQNMQERNLDLFGNMDEKRLYTYGDVKSSSDNRCQTQDRLIAKDDFLLRSDNHRRDVFPGYNDGANLPPDSSHPVVQAPIGASSKLRQSRFAFAHDGSGGLEDSQHRQNSNNANMDYGPNLKQNPNMDAESFFKTLLPNVNVSFSSTAPNLTRTGSQSVQSVEGSGFGINNHMPPGFSQLDFSSHQQQASSGFGSHYQHNQKHTFVTGQNENGVSMIFQDQQKVVSSLARQLDHSVEIKASNPENHFSHSNGLPSQRKEFNAYGRDLSNGYSQNGEAVYSAGATGLEMANGRKESELHYVHNQNFNYGDQMPRRRLEGKLHESIDTNDNT